MITDFEAAFRVFLQVAAGRDEQRFTAAFTVDLVLLAVREPFVRS